MTAALQSKSRPNYLSLALFELDAWLREQQGVYEYTADDNCIFRLQTDKAVHPYAFSEGGAVAAGEPVLRLHIWNEHVPRIGANGPDFAWARQFSRQLDHSLELLDRHLHEQAAHYRSIKVICADMTLEPADRKEQLGRAAQRFGFEWAEADASVGQPLRRLGENVLMLLLVAASNPASLRWSILKRDHSVAFLPRQRLESRYVGRRQARSAIA